MFNSSRIGKISEEAGEREYQAKNLAGSIKKLEKQLPYIELLPRVDQTEYLAVLKLLMQDANVVESLLQLKLRGVKTVVQNSALTKAQVEINQYGELELSTGVTLESLRWFLGLFD